MKQRDPAFQKAFGQHIKAIREEREWSQRQLAAISGIDETQISRIENGTQSANLQTILSLATALGKYPGELFSFEYNFRLNDDFGPYNRKAKPVPTTLIVTALSQTAFFDTPRSVAEIIAFCKASQGIVLQSPATSAVLKKLVNEKILKRIPAKIRGRFLYQKRK